MAEGANVVDGREGGEGIRGEQQRGCLGHLTYLPTTAAGDGKANPSDQGQKAAGGTPEGAGREKSARYRGEGEGADSRKKSPRQGLKMTATRRHSLLTAGNDVRRHCGV